MLTKDKVLSLRDLALDHMPKSRELRDNVRRVSGNSTQALRVIAGAPDATLCDVAATAIERRAAVLLNLVQQHPDALVELLNEPAPCNDDFPGQLEQILANDARVKQSQTESLMLETARMLCELSGASLPPWMMPIKCAAPSGWPENDGQGEIRRRGTFVAEVTSFWPTIEQDLSDSGRNGLHDVAKHQDHGFWKVEPAIKWAAERGKITKGRVQTFIASNEESHLSPMLRILLKLD